MDGEWENVSDISNTDMFFPVRVHIGWFLRTRDGFGNDFSSVSLVSGASSRFGFDVVGTASLPTEFLMSGAAPSLEFGQVVHYVYNHGRTVDDNAASTATLTVVSCVWRLIAVRI